MGLGSVGGGWGLSERAACSGGGGGLRRGRGEAEWQRKSLVKTEECVVVANSRGQTAGSKLIETQDYRRADNAVPPRTKHGPKDCVSRAQTRPQRPGVGDARRYAYQARDPEEDETCRVKDGARSADKPKAWGLRGAHPYVRRWALGVPVRRYDYKARFPARGTKQAGCTDEANVSET